eukprot:6643519-Prymnesium_polylepis.1
MGPYGVGGMHSSARRSSILLSVPSTRLRDARRVSDAYTPGKRAVCVSLCHPRPCACRSGLRRLSYGVRMHVSPTGKART